MKSILCNKRKPKFECSIFFIVVYYEHVITKRSDVDTKQPNCKRSVQPQSTRVKKEVKSKVAAKKWL